MRKPHLAKWRPLSRIRSFHVISFRLRFIESFNSLLLRTLLPFPPDNLLLLIRRRLNLISRLASRIIKSILGIEHLALLQLRSSSFVKHALSLLLFFYYFLNLFFLPGRHEFQVGLLVHYFVCFF